MVLYMCSRGGKRGANGPHDRGARSRSIDGPSGERAKTSHPAHEVDRSDGGRRGRQCRSADGRCAWYTRRKRLLHDGTATLRAVEWDGCWMVSRTGPGAVSDASDCPCDGECRKDNRLSDDSRVFGWGRSGVLQRWRATRAANAMTRAPSGGKGTGPGESEPLRLD